MTTCRLTVLITGSLKRSKHPGNVGFEELNTLNYLHSSFGDVVQIRRRMMRHCLKIKHEIG